MRRRRHTGGMAWKSTDRIQIKTGYKREIPSPYWLSRNNLARVLCCMSIFVLHDSRLCAEHAVAADILQGEQFPYELQLARRQKSYKVVIPCDAYAHSSFAPNTSPPACATPRGSEATLKRGHPLSRLRHRGIETAKEELFRLWLVSSTHPSAAVNGLSKPLPR